MYGKIFESMYDGTLSADWKAMVTFQQMIVLADKHGVVDITPPALSRRTGIPLDIIEHGVEKLEQPDKWSRTGDHDGKRIVRLDDHRPWGWQIVNYEYYRDLASREDRRVKDRARKREERSKSLNGKDVHICPDLSTMSRHADADADAVKKGQKRTVLTTRFDEFWTVYPRKRKKKPAKDIWRRKKLDRLADTLIADVQARIANDDQWKKGFIPDPTTYLNQERWEDELKREDSKPTLDGEAAAYGIKRQPNETDESLKRRLGVAMTNARYAR